MEETTDSGSWGDSGTWIDLFSKGIDKYVSYEQSKETAALEQQRLAAQNPIYVRNEDNRTVRAGTSSGLISPFSPVGILGAVAVLGLLAVIMLRR